MVITNDGDNCALNLFYPFDYTFLTMKDQYPIYCIHIQESKCERYALIRRKIIITCLRYAKNITNKENHGE